jgi:hypothetical protein
MPYIFRFEIPSMRSEHLAIFLVLIVLLSGCEGFDDSATTKAVDDALAK